MICCSGCSKVWRHCHGLHRHIDRQNEPQAGTLCPRHSDQVGRVESDLVRRLREQTALLRISRAFQADFFSLSAMEPRSYDSVPYREPESVADRTVSYTLTVEKTCAWVVSNIANKTYKRKHDKPGAIHQASELFYRSCRTDRCGTPRHGCLRARCVIRVSFRPCMLKHSLRETANWRLAADEAAAAAVPVVVTQLRSLSSCEDTLPRTACSGALHR